jgi:hypothetical protein
MAISSWNAGIIRPVPVPPAGPFEDGAAPGVWTLDQATFWIKQGLWPLAGNVNIANRGLIFGGFAGSSALTNIRSFSFSNLAVLTTFGNLAVGTSYPVGAASSTRGVMAGGFSYISETVANLNVISYVTLATTGNATDFGDLTQARYALAGTSNNTRALFAGGTTGTTVNTIDYITIESVGNAVDFGDLNTAGLLELASCASPTRALFAAGQLANTALSSQIRYSTIATTGNTTNFGTLSYSARLVGGASSNTRAVFAGGFSGDGAVNNIEYVTIATTGNAVDFGDLQPAAYFDTATSNSITGVFLIDGGSQKVTIASLGNAIGFSGISGFGNFGSLSGGHGGL